MAAASGLHRCFGDGREVDRRAVREHFGVAAGESLKTVEQGDDSCVFVAHGGDHRVGRWSLGEGFEVHAERGERGAQFVPGVGRETPRRLHAALEPLEHAVECRRQFGDLALPADCGQSLVQPHGRGTVAQPVERAQHEPGQQPGGDRRSEGRGQRDERDQPGVVAQPLVDGLQALEDLQLPTTRGLDQRAPALTGELDRRESWLRRADREGLPARREHPCAVDHARRRVRGRERVAAVVAGEQGRAGLAHVGLDLGRLRTQRAVDLRAILMVDSQRDHKARERDRAGCEERGTDRDLGAQAPHGRSTNPMPRTVCSNRGSPILRRT